MKRGFTLVEVLVALLIVEIGLMGALGLMVLGSRALTDAVEKERALSAFEAVADSLAWAPAATTGTRVEPWGVLRWSVGDSGSIRITSVRGEDTLVVRGHSR